MAIGHGNPPTCYLKYANPGLTYTAGAFSGGKNCTAPTGNDSEPPLMRHLGMSAACRMMWM